MNASELVAVLSLPGSAISAPLRLELVLTPAPNRPGHYAAHLGDRCILRASRQPLFDGARMLAGEGAPPEAILTTRHAGSSIVATRSTVGEASRWTIEESDTRGLRRRPWRPHPGAISGGAEAPENDRGEAPGTDRPAGRPSAFPGVPTPPRGRLPPRNRRQRSN